MTNVDEIKINHRTNSEALKRHAKGMSQCFIQNEDRYKTVRL